MNVLLVNPRTTTIATNSRKKKSEIPIGLLYIAGSLRECGCNVAIYDANLYYHTIEDAVHYILNKKPAIIGYTATTANIGWVGKLNKLVKRKKVNIISILGGIHATAMPKETLSYYPDFDYLVVGEGEITIRELIKALETGEPIKQIKGISFLNNQDYTYTGKRQYVEDLDQLPFPAYDLLLDNFHLYSYTEFRTLNNPSVNLITSRGCDKACKFCAHNLTSKNIRYHSAEYVLNTIEYFIKHFNVKNFIFDDDSFLSSKERCIEICNEIKKRKIKISWSCLARVDEVNYEILCSIRKAGCWLISFGIESGDQMVLDFISKGVNIEQCYQAVNIANRAGLITDGFFMIGLPKETKSTIIKTAEFPKKLGLNMFSLNFFSPFPGTTFWRSCEKYGLVNRNWDEMFTGVHRKPSFVPHGITEADMKQAAIYSFNNFFTSINYLKLLGKLLFNFNKPKKVVIIIRETIILKSIIRKIHNSI